MMIFPCCKPPSYAAYRILAFRLSKLVGSTTQIKSRAHTCSRSSTPTTIEPSAIIWQGGTPRSRVGSKSIGSISPESSWHRFRSSAEISTSFMFGTYSTMPVGGSGSTGVGLGIILPIYSPQMAIARRPPSRQSQIASTGMAKSSKQSLQRQQRTWVVGIMLLMVTDERHTCTTSRTLTWEATIRITTAHRERRWMTLSDIASTLTFSTTDLGEAIFSSVVPVREDKSEVDVELYGEACEDEDLERMRCGRASHTLRALYYNPG